jgi:hypothetical protein
VGVPARSQARSTQLLRRSMTAPLRKKGEAAPRLVKSWRPERRESTEDGRRARWRHTRPALGLPLNAFVKHHALKCRERDAEIRVSKRSANHPRLPPCQAGGGAEAEEDEGAAVTRFKWAAQ